MNTIAFQIGDEDKKQIQIEARKSGLSMAGFCRHLILENIKEAQHGKETSK